MRIISVASITALIMVLTCCTSRHEATFARADSLMEEYPDSALALLETIDTATLTTDRDRAMYGLLLTQAMYKNGFSVGNDSLIASSARYFNTRNNKDYKTRANFYLAAVNYKNGYMPKSLKYAMQCYDLAESVGNPLWAARSSELIADIYRSSYINDEELKYRLKALSCYKWANWSKNIPWALLEVGTAYRNLEDYEKADSVFDEVILLAKQRNDSALLTCTLEQMIELEMQKPDYEQTKRYLNELKNIQEEENIRGSLLATLILIHLNEGQYIPEEYLLKLVEDTCCNNYIKSLYYEVRKSESLADGNLDKTLKYTDSLVILQNRLFSDATKQSIIREQRDFYQNKSIEEENKRNKIRLTALTIAAFSVLAIIIIILFLLYRIKRKNEIIQNKIADILTLREEIKQNQSHIDELRNQNNSFTEQIEKLEKYDGAIVQQQAQIDQLFYEHYLTLNRLCYEYYEKRSMKNRNTVIKSIEKEIELMRNPQYTERLIEHINKYKNNLYKIFSDEITSLSEKDEQLLIFILSGLAPRTICLAMNMDIKQYYNRRDHIIKKINNSNAPHKQEFLAKISDMRYNYASKKAL